MQKEMRRWMIKKFGPALLAFLGHSFSIRMSSLPVMPSVTCSSDREDGMLILQREFWDDRDIPLPYRPASSPAILVSSLGKASGEDLTRGLEGPAEDE